LTKVAAKEKKEQGTNRIKNKERGTELQSNQIKNKNHARNGDRKRTRSLHNLSVQRKCLGAEHSDICMQTK